MNLNISDYRKQTNTYDLNGMKLIHRSKYLNRPEIPSIEIISSCFLFYPLQFRFKNDVVSDILTNLEWFFFSNICDYISFTDDESYYYVQRCKHILDTHVIFHYMSKTTGMLCILPDGFYFNSDTQYFEPRNMHVSLPSEFTFKHEKIIFDDRSFVCRDIKNIVDHIMYNHQHPIGEKCGTFYRSMGGDIVLVSPYIKTIGKLVTNEEWAHIYSIRCSIIQTSLRMNPLTHGINILNIIEKIPNPNSDPSYIVINDLDIPYWTSCINQLSIPFPLFVVSYSEFTCTKLSHMHILVLDEAHLMKDYVVSPGSANHIICMSTRVSESKKRLYTLCGIDTLPFPPIDIEDEICIYQTGTDIVIPTIKLLDPDENIRRLHTSFMNENMILRPSNTHLKDKLLMSCTGAEVEVSNVTVIDDDIHVINVCKKSAYFDSVSDGCMVCLRRIKTCMSGVLLTCGHVLCQSCTKRIISMGSGRTCPMCRQPFIGNNLYRPVIGSRHNVNRTFTMHSKLSALYSYMCNFAKANVDRVLCVVTSSHEVAKKLSEMLPPSVSSTFYGFGEEKEVTSDTIIIFCRLGSYDRYIESVCTSVLVSDIYGESCDVATILHNTKDVTLMLMNECLDALIFKQWCIKWSV